MSDIREFEGEAIKKVKGVVAGDVGDTRLNGLLKIGDEVLVVVKATVKGILHEESDTGLMRVQRLKATEGYLVEDETDAADLLHKLRADRKAALDALLGTPPLFDEEDAG